MADERPNVTVIYQEAKPTTPGLGAILLELFVFLLAAGLVALVAGGGCMVFM
ncbi:MAG: hypothetical protein ACOYNY_34955 [Caldilineaceae bacterium]